MSSLKLDNYVVINCKTLGIRNFTEKDDCVKYVSKELTDAISSFFECNAKIDRINKKFVLKIFRNKIWKEKVNSLMNERRSIAERILNLVREESANDENIIT